MIIRYFLHIFNGNTDLPCAALRAALGFRSLRFHRALRGALLLPLAAAGLVYPLWLVGNVPGVIQRADAPLHEEDSSLLFLFLAVLLLPLRLPYQLYQLQTR